MFWNNLSWLVKAPKFFPDPFLILSGLCRQSLPALSPIPSTGDLPPEVTSSSDLASLIVVELSAVAGVLQSKHAAVSFFSFAV